MEQIRLVLQSLSGKETVIASLPFTLKNHTDDLLDILSVEITPDGRQAFTVAPKGDSPFEIRTPQNVSRDEPRFEHLDKLVVGSELDDIYVCYDFHAYKSKGDKSSPNGNKSSTKMQENLDRFFPKNLQAQLSAPPVCIGSVSQMTINTWNFEERELLKKSLLSFGYNRWEHIQKCFKEHKDFGMREKSISEIASYSQSLIRSIADNLNFQNIDLKTLLLTMINQQTSETKSLESDSLSNLRENEMRSNITSTGNNALCSNQDPTVSQTYSSPQLALMTPHQVVCVSSRDWDLNSIRQRAKPWAKRLQIMYRINNFIRDYECYYTKVTDSPPRNTYSYSAMLDFIDAEALQGQKPCHWWTKLQDVYLIISTYNIGYANYNFSFLYKNQNLSVPKHLNKEYLTRPEKRCFDRLFLNTNRPDFYSEVIAQSFPNADAITRRLKKLLSIIYKMSIEDSSFDPAHSGSFIDEPEILKMLESDQLRIIEYLTVNGLPLDGESNKISYDILKMELKGYLSHTPDSKMLEKFVQCCLISAFIYIKEPDSETPEVALEIHNKLFSSIRRLFTLKTAEKFLRQVNIVNYVRKYIWNNFMNNKLFDDYKAKNLKLVSEAMASGQISRQYADLYTSLLEYGRYCELVAHFKEYGFSRNSLIVESMKIDFRVILNHLENFVEFLKPSIENQNFTLLKKRKTEFLLQPNIQSNEGLVGPNNVDKLNRNRPTLKKVKLEVTNNALDDQAISDMNFPISVTSSLKLLALGKVNTFPNYHSEHNIFPLGFKTERTYFSMFHKDTRCEYICEILEGDGKPIFKVTSSEDPDHPIIRDSSTGCWIYICKKVNDLSDNKKEKVTISGTERFGLIDHMIASLVERLPDAGKCKKYKFKHFDPSNNK
jgi:hypothetical protein